MSAYSIYVKDLAVTANETSYTTNGGDLTWIPDQAPIRLEISDKPLVCLKDSTPDLSNVSVLAVYEGDVKITIPSRLLELGTCDVSTVGLKTLTVISDAEKAVKEINPSFDIENIPLDDAETFRMMSGGLTDGVFQFESSGMKNLLRKMKPVCFEDLAAALALYRPGPM